MVLSGKDIKHWLFLAVFIIVIIMFLRLLLPFIAPLILSAIIVSIFTPVYYFFNRWLPQSAASFICCVLICVIIFIPFVLVITILANQALTLYASVMNSEFMMNLTAEVDGNWIVSQANLLLEKLNIGYTINGDQIYQFVGKLGSRFGLFLYNQATNITSNFIRLIINFFFMILISYYLFGNGRRVISFFVGLSPLPEGDEVAVLQRLKTTAGAIFFGNFISGIIQGTIGGITLWYFGFPAPFLWAVIMVILAFLPIVGIGLVFVPCIIITFVGGDYLHGILMAVIYVAASSITEYIIIPRIQGKRSHMHTVFIFLSVLGGLQMFGIIGVLYGPLIITAFLALYDIYRANYIEQPELNGGTGGLAAAANGPEAELKMPAGVEPPLGRPPAGLKMEATDDNVALGDDIEPEFYADSGELVCQDLDVCGLAAGNACGGDEPGGDELEDDELADNDGYCSEISAQDTDVTEGYGAGRAPREAYPGTSFTDYPPGNRPPAKSEASDNPDGLIWNNDRPAHLPFPRAEGAERLMMPDSDANPDISIKDIVRADITSFGDRAATDTDDEDDSSDDKTTDDKTTKE